jgi:hypothetical protein
MTDWSAIPISQFIRRVVLDATQNRDFPADPFGPVPPQNSVAGHALFTNTRQNANHPKERDTAMSLTRHGVPRNRSDNRLRRPVRTGAGAIATNPHETTDHVG